jgi:hypothetical protein
MKILEEITAHTLEARQAHRRAEAPTASIAPQTIACCHESLLIIRWVPNVER